MASQTPFFLADNVFDRINLYPLALLTWNTPIAGQEGNYVADYRRERSAFQAAAAAVNQGIVTNLGAGGNVLADTCWIDRGHNLWGKNLQVGAGADGVTWTETVTRVVPAIGTVGGDPTTSWCVTEEGALYTILPSGTFTTARQYWLVRVTDNWAPLITGIILGKRTQLLNYSSVLDEDEGERDERQENSLIKGYYGRDRVYSARKLRVQLATIGISDYDTNIRALRRLLFERDQPAFIVMNYGNKPERGWLYQYQGGTFSAPAERVYRRASFVMQELGPAIR
jgi:hypothetical protein